MEVVSVAVVILQRAVVNNIDNGHHEGEGVLLDAAEQRLQPASVALAVAVQVEDHLPGGGARPLQPRPDETLALRQPHQLDLAGQVAVDVALKLAPQVRLVAEVVHQDDLVHEVGGRAVEDGPDGADERAPGLVGEDDDDGGGREEGRVADGSAAPVSRVRYTSNVGDLVTHNQIECLRLLDVVCHLCLVSLQHDGLPSLAQPAHLPRQVFSKLVVHVCQAGLGAEQVGPAHRHPVHCNITQSANFPSDDSFPLLNYQLWQ